MSSPDNKQKTIRKRKNAECFQCDTLKGELQEARGLIHELRKKLEAWDSCHCMGDISYCEICNSHHTTRCWSQMAEVIEPCEEKNCEADWVNLCCYCKEDYKVKHSKTCKFSSS